MSTLADLMPELLELHRGLPFHEPWELKTVDEAGELASLDMTGGTLVAGIREKSGATVTAFTVAVVDAAAGSVEVSLTAEQIADLSGRILSWDAIFYSSLGKPLPYGYGPVKINDTMSDV